MPDIEFVNSPRSEIDRLKLTARIIGSGFYEKQGFVVVPELDLGVAATSQVIYRRELEYQPIRAESWEREWGRVEVEFWEYLKELVPNAKLHGPLEVRLTRYGTVASSGKLGMVPHEKTIYYLRSDADLSDLAAMIVNNILYYDRKNLGITWTKREALMDFIMTRPAMKKLFPDFDPVFFQLSRVPVVLRKMSEEYVRNLGIVKKAKEFEKVGTKIFIGGKEMGKELSKMEKKILGCFMDHPGDLVNYDELADVVWGEGEFKSFWALNKLVERLRNKLVGLGIAGERLESVRGQGYLLQ